MWKRWLWMGGAALLVIGVGLVGVRWYRQAHLPPLPKEITEQANFSPYYPGLADLEVDRTSISFTARTQLLTFAAALKAPKSRLTFTEQPTPDSRSDGGAGFDTTLKAAGKNHEISTKVGKAILFNGSDATKSTIGVLSSEGAVVYIKSSVSLNNSSWQEIFDSLYFVK